MSDSIFWKKLADKFGKLPQKTLVLQAEKHYMVGQTEDAKWRLMGKIERKAEFEALARRGASRFSTQPTPDLLEVWIEKIFQTVPDDQDHSSFGTIKSQGTGTNTVGHHIHDLSRRSIAYCKIMEAEAIQKEFDDSMTQEPHPLPRTTVTPAQETPSIASQIQRLRLECKWSIETLAAKTGFDDRTVRRHLSGETKPHLRNIGTYEQAFSKALKREVVIDNMP
jgi:hypothetical protein